MMMANIRNLATLAQTQQYYKLHMNYPCYRHNLKQRTAYTITIIHHREKGDYVSKQKTALNNKKQPKIISKCSVTIVHYTKNVFKLNLQTQKLNRKKYR